MLSQTGMASLAQSLLPSFAFSFLALGHHTGERGEAEGGVISFHFSS